MIADQLKHRGQDHLPRAGSLWNLCLQPMAGAIAVSSVPNGGLTAKCQGCGASFMLKTFVQACPECGGVHAVSPPRAYDPTAIQFAGEDFALPTAA